MPIIDPSHSIFANEAAAQTVADQCAKDDAGDGYNYLVRVDPKGSGRAVIEVYDETGYLLGKL